MEVARVEINFQENSFCEIRSQLTWRPAWNDVRYHSRTASIRSSGVGCSGILKYFKQNHRHGVQEFKKGINLHDL